MKHYYITYEDEETKKKNINLFCEIRDKGKCLKGEWQGDYFINTFEYKGKLYELHYNEELGVMSEVIEL